VRFLPTVGRATTFPLQPRIDALEFSRHTRGMQVKDITIRTLWRTAFEQCELVFLGLRGCRLRLWIRGALVVDEEVFDLVDAGKRAADLRVEWASPREGKRTRVSRYVGRR